ncbi:hypothetical protein M433DRAFT_487807 [Acidomyces richmondensis BFW]|nr:hypothetical protein M433DRAFT_487807 [Acidomyces richmondensis BFW]
MRCYRDHSRGAQIAPSDSSSSSSSSVLGSSTVSEQRRQRSSWWNQDDRQLPQQQVQESDCRWGHSEETLFWTGRLERVDSQDTLVELPCRTGTGRMSETAVGQNVVERRRSYGIGGAGNMRFPSQVKAAEQAIAAPDHGGTRRRRGSTWSMQSAGSLVEKLFRRGSKGADSSGSSS